MAVRRAPALFISHGGPPLAIDTKDFLHPFFKQQLPKMLPAAPTAIVVVSAVRIPSTLLSLPMSLSMHC